MNRKFFRNCLILGIIGLLIVGGIAGLWYFFYGTRGGALPTVRFIQPETSLAISSGQGVVIIVAGQSALGLERVELFVDGQLERSASAFGEAEFQAIFPWFGSGLGDHELRAIGYDRGGRASQPVSVVVRVQAADVRAMLENAQPLDVNQTIEEIILQAEGAEQPGGDPRAIPPADPGGVGQPGGAGEPPQADGEPPTAELIVTPQRNGNSVAAVVEMRARDNVGLGLMRLEIQTPVGIRDNFVEGCEGNLECSFEFVHPLAESGAWVFILRAIDLSGQVSLPDWADVQVICALGQDENNQPIEECAVANEELPAPGNAPGNLPPGLEELQACEGVEPPQESFVVNGCEIILPVVPGGPVTQCESFDLEGEDLRGVDLRNARLRESNLQDANLMCGADLRGADLRLANLYRTKRDASTQFDPKWDQVWEVVNQGGFNRDFIEVDLSESLLFHADLFSAGLIDADLRGARFEGANLFGADLFRADLADTVWVDTKCPDGTNSSANGDTCVWNLPPGIPRREDFMVEDCLIVQPVPLDRPYTDCPWASLQFQDLRMVDFTNANLFNANFRLTDLRGADFSGANLARADLSSADVSGAIWNDTICPDFVNSNENNGTCEGHLTP